MKFTTLLLWLGLFFSFTGANAAGLALSERDCIDILERWAADPSSVPQHLVDECREMMGAGAPVPDIKPAAGEAVAVVDPCSGPDAANSVQCWGPWGFLAPAAGPVVPVVVAAVDLPDVCPDTVDECDRGVVPAIQPPPLGACSPGAPCGFATIVPATTEPSTGDPDAVVAFDLAADGSQFTVDPGGPREIASNTNLQKQPSIGPERFRSIENGVGSQWIAGTTRDNQGNIIDATGDWDKADLISPDPANTNSGRFVWGVASSQATLDSLNNGGQGISIAFSGRMTRDVATQANVTVNFGAQPNWNGNWSNNVRNYQFDAGGSVNGVNIVSDPSQFSANVVQGSGSYVQGALLGERGGLSVGHAIDVTLSSGESIKDVGLIRQR